MYTNILRILRIIRNWTTFHLHQLVLDKFSTYWCDLLKKICEEKCPPVINRCWFVSQVIHSIMVIKWIPYCTTMRFRWTIIGYTGLMPKNFSSWVLFLRDGHNKVLEILSRMTGDVSDVSYVIRQPINKLHSLIFQGYVLQMN